MAEGKYSKYFLREPWGIVTKANQDPDQPVQLEIRKFVVKRIIKILEEKFFKKVKVNYT